MTTTPCPGCSKALRVSARVVSDGNEYLFYMCPRCQDVAFEDPEDGSWRLRGEASSTVTEVIEMLQSLAVETWRKRSTTRKPIASSDSRRA